MADPYASKAAVDGTAAAGHSINHNLVSLQTAIEDLQPK
jgi:hypothetical protein